MMNLLNFIICSSEMDSLSKDVLFNIATMLDLDSLLSFCNSNPRIKELIYQNEDIWNFKLVSEFPDYKHHVDKSGREAYELLIGLTKLKKELAYGGTIYQLYNVEYLDLNSRELTSLPPEIYKLDRLHNLWLYNNQIKTLSPEIGKMSQLQYLYLSHNQIETLPSEIGKLTQLQVLSLNSNQITILASEIGNLSQLRYLNLCDNKIKKLPVEMHNLSRLDYLAIDKDVITPPQLENIRFCI